MALDLDHLFSVSVLLATILVVVGCTSDPGPRQVAQDIIEAEYERDKTLDKDCLLARLKEWTDDELREIVAGLDASTPDERQAAQDQLDEFEASLAGCVPTTSTTTTSPPGGTTTINPDN
ncbi:MAG: hypothetical protein WA964_01930 [Ilumatobacter sp.]|uniref:hypothetical protein n=1 Tax=Ilumatobacter sp. TaxID=1967498 RepID=UPI003C7673E8